MISLYTTAFNLDKINIYLDEIFSNWLCYVDEIVIATFRSQHVEVMNRVARSNLYDPKKIRVVSKHVEIETDIYWEGKLKNTALQNCKNEVALQCDLDERISGDIIAFKNIAEELIKHDFPCSVMMPTIDLYEDLNHYVSIGQKWYIHKKEGSSRGSVNWARKEDGTLDPEKSDTCELVDVEGNLIPCIGKIEFTRDGPKIIHLGYLDLDERNKVNKFWGKIWNHRHKGKFDQDYKMDQIKAGDPRKKPHDLSHPLWPTR